MNELKYLIIVLVFLLCGCSTVNNQSFSSEYVVAESQVSTDMSTEEAVSKKIESQAVSSQKNISVIAKEEINSSNTKNSNQQVKDEKHKEKPKTSEPKISDSVPEDTFSVNIEASEENTESTVTETQVTLSEPIQVTEPNATKADEKIIAEKMVEYINQYRKEQGVSSAAILPGLTKYAEYRSRQLVSNFAHATSDGRAAAKDLKYGEYIDPTIYGSTGEPYYRVNAREAILKAGYVGTVDKVAESLALLVKGSSGHWNYVGGEEYIYIAIGVTYEGGMWYSAIEVSIVNID